MTPTPHEAARRAAFEWYEEYQANVECPADEDFDWYIAGALEKYAAAARAQARAEERANDGPLLTCPWCGTGLVGRIAQAQISHLIDCGDSYRAARSAPTGGRDE